MRHVTLSGTDLTTSALGFGCAPLMARVPRRESRRVLEAAFAAGITHFDTARSYGYGATESVVADFITGRRSAVTVTTKFGIVPPRRSLALQTAKAVARRVVALRPSLRSSIRREAERLLVGGRFSVNDARTSLETSLRELRTDYVDILLLHECTLRDVEAPALLDFLEACVRQGKIRYFGIATDGWSTREILARRPEFGAVVQCAWEPGSQSPDTLGAGRTALIAHSVLGKWLNHLSRYLTEQPDRDSYWSAVLGADYRSPHILAGLLLCCASWATPSGLVLFSSLREDHIGSNAEALTEGRYAQEQIEALMSLLLESAPASQAQGGR